ncbi:MAG: S1/P1 nuclease [Pyrinomonadaceae bacterium]|nr:S1/P1 nuclease [Pyrinomonadaceae bacterium]
MRKGHRLVALALLWILVSSVPSYGWWDLGHMAVAYVAYQKLTQQKKDRVDVLLRMNPDLENWLKLIPPGTSKADERMMIFMIAATWPDRIKNDSHYKDDGTEGGNVPDGKPTNSQNIGYEDLFLHKYWHFVDVPFTQDGTKLPGIPVPNAKTQINVFRSVLASNSSDALKSYDLSWLLHVVGDVHQPLHCIARHGKTQPHGDAGGNFVKLCAAPCKDVLHGFWDGLPGESNNPVDAIKVAKQLPKANKNRASKLDTTVWIKESFWLRKYVYAAPIGLGSGPFKITNAYRKTAKGIANQRVALAGARLGNILNKELK